MSTQTTDPYEIDVIEESCPDCGASRGWPCCGGVTCDGRVDYARVVDFWDHAVEGVSHGDD